MNYAAPPSRDSQVALENIDDFYSAMLEYYDELFPLDPAAAGFFSALKQEIASSSTILPPPMCRYLGVGCATGNLENQLAGEGFDVTGMDRNASMIETAKRRMKRGFSTIRFFELSSIDMKRFLKKGSFNIVACLENTLPYISDETLLRKFFYDAHELLAPGGKLVIHTLNYDYLRDVHPVILPERSSIRVSLSRTLIPSEEGRVLLDASLELGNGRKLVLQRKTSLMPVTAGQIEAFAREAGFASCTLFGGFNGSSWSQESPSTIAVLG